MRCEATRKMLEAYQDGRLSRSVAADIEGHLAACDECREELRVIERTMSLLDEWGSADPRLAFADLQHRLAHRTEMRTRSWFPVPRWAAAGMAMASVIIGLWLGSVAGSNVSYSALTPEQVVAAMGMNPTDDAIEDSLLAGIYVERISSEKGVLR